MMVLALETLVSLIAGLVAAVVVGIPVGILMGRSKIARLALDPYVTFLYVLPTIALIPLLIVWFGFELTLRIVMVFLSAVFPIIINTTAGVLNVDPELLDIGRSFTASEKQIVNTIVLPSAVPYMFAGLRIAFGAGFVGVIVAEMTASLAGLGGMIFRASGNFKTAEMFVPIIYIMTIGLSLYGLGNALQGRLTHWQQDEGIV